MNAPIRLLKFGSRIRTALVLVAVLALCALAAGCGKKAWPTPQDTEHTFSFAGLNSQNRGGCLVIEGRIEGAWKNVEAVYLEYGANECDGCPFVPERSVEYARGDANFFLEQGVLRVTRCGLEPDSAYRWRLTGVNVLGAIKDVSTDIMSTK